MSIGDIALIIAAVISLFAGFIRLHWIGGLVLGFILAGGLYLFVQDDVAHAAIGEDGFILGSVGFVLAFGLGSFIIFMLGSWLSGSIRR